jgi:CubicO group peptidase (beta-lactamase class C family)
MGKSITATLIGLLIREGALSLDQPAPVPAWQAEGDPRKAITVRNLLNMSSGLHFTAPRDPDYSEDKGYPDHMLIYTGAVDAFEFSYGKPLQFPPGTEGRYRNSDPLTLGYLVKGRDRARRRLPCLPQRALFDRIGIRKQSSTDPYGNFFTGYDYGPPATGPGSTSTATACGSASGSCRRASPSSSRPRRQREGACLRRPLLVNGRSDYALPKEPTTWRAREARRRSSPSHDLVTCTATSVAMARR